MSAREQQGSEKKKTSEIMPSYPGIGLGIGFETGAITALLIPLCYTAGWSYAYHYFERFSLGLIGLDIPREYFFVYGFQAIKDQKWLFLLTLIICMSLLVLGRFLLERLKKSFANQTKANTLNIIPAVILPVMIFALFMLFYNFGEKTAVNVYEQQVKSDFNAYIRVQVWAEAPKNAKYGAAMAKEWQKGCYRLLMRNKDYVFIFYPMKFNGKISKELKIPTDVIPAAKVELIRILPVNESCL